MASQEKYSSPSTFSNHRLKLIDDDQEDERGDENQSQYEILDFFKKSRLRKNTGDEEFVARKSKRKSTNRGESIFLDERKSTRCCSRSQLFVGVA